MEQAKIEGDGVNDEAKKSTNRITEGAGDAIGRGSVILN